MSELQTMPLRFRIWEKDNQQFYHEVLPNDEIKIEFDIFEIQFRIGDLDEKERDNIIISQDTGLKDTNGKSIYTGDIVQCWDDDDYEGVVYYDGTRLRCRVKFNDGDDGALASSEPVVIGNIWQNPELIGADNV